MNLRYLHPALKAAGFIAALAISAVIVSIQEGKIKLPTRK